MTLELYDTTLGDGAWDDRFAFALPEADHFHQPEVFPTCFCRSPSSTFYKRPEDRTLLIFQASDRTGMSFSWAPSYISSNPVDL